VRSRGTLYSVLGRHVDVLAHLRATSPGEPPTAMCNRTRDEIPLQPKRLTVRTRGSSMHTTLRLQKIVAAHFQCNVSRTQSRLRTSGAAVASVEARSDPAGSDAEPFSSSGGMVARKARKGGGGQHGLGFFDWNDFWCREPDSLWLSQSAESVERACRPISRACRLDEALVQFPLEWNQHRLR
jgi:hypothetical protein